MRIWGFILLIFLISSVSAEIAHVVIDQDFDSQKNASGEYLYNDSTTIYFNETKLNITINSLDNDTIFYAGGIYIYKNDSNYFILNETKLNQTINLLDTDTTYDAEEFYVYMDGTTVRFNETILNATISSLDTDTQLSGAEVVALVGNWSADKVNYYNKTEVYNKSESDSKYIQFDNESNLNVNNSQYLQGYNISTLGTWLESNFGWLNSISNIFDQVLNTTSSVIFSSVNVTNNITLNGSTIDDWSDVNISETDPYSLHLNQDNWNNDSNGWINWDGDSNEFNESKLSTIYYDVSSVNNVTGETSGSLSDIQSYDSVPYNVTETTGSPGMDLRVNFTGVASFNSLVIRYKTESAESHLVEVQLYNYVDGIWEDYGFMGQVENYETKVLGVFDGDEHLSGGVVQLRFLSQSPGNIAHVHHFDWVTISQGYGTPSGQEVDPFWTSEKGNYYNKTETDSKFIQFDNESNLNVNSSTNWAGYNSTNSSQFENSNNILNINSTWLESYINSVGNFFSGSWGDLTDVPALLYGLWDSNNDNSLLVTNGTHIGYNSTILNQTIESLDSDTIFYAGGVYIYKNGSNYFILNETKLNATIELLDSDTTYTAEEIYIYLDGTTIRLNETLLNATIESLDSVLSGAEVVALVGNWSADKVNYYNKTEIDSRGFITSDNVAYTNESNTFTQQQNFEGRLNVTDGIDLNNNATISRDGSGTQIYIDENGNIDITLG